MKQTILFLIALSFLSSFIGKEHFPKIDCKGAITDKKIEELSEFSKKFYDKDFTGVVTKTYEKSEILNWRLHLQNGEIIKYEGFYENGEPKILEPVKCNSMHGNLIIYRANSKKGYELEFNLGKKDGIGKSYYANGKVQKEVHYKNDLREGKQYKFDEKVDTISIEIFKNGVQLK